MWFNQLHAYVHKQHQQKFTINDIDYNHSQSNLITLTFHTKNSHKPHKYKQNFSQTQTNSQTFTYINSQSQSPNTPNISLTLIKQRSSQHNHIFFYPKNLSNYFSKKTAHVLLEVCFSSHVGDPWKSPNTLQQFLFIMLKFYLLMNSEYPFIYSTGIFLPYQETFIFFYTNEKHFLPCHENLNQVKLRIEGNL